LSVVEEECSLGSSLLFEGNSSILGLASWGDLNAGDLAAAESLLLVLLQAEMGRAMTYQKEKKSLTSFSEVALLMFLT
jgi:hypothetical protein